MVQNTCSMCQHSLVVFAGAIGLLLTCCATPTQGQTLTAKLCSAQLPLALTYSSPLYDGYDSIYLIGGYTGINYTQALKYSISEDRIEEIGSLPLMDYGGGAVMDKHKNIFYIGGKNTRDIYRYNPEPRTFSKVGMLPWDNHYFATIQVDEETAFIIGGNEKKPAKTILSLNLASMSSEDLGGELPQATYYSSAIWVKEKGSAYIVQDGFMKYNRPTNVTVEIPLEIETSYQGQVVWDGKFAYVIGGLHARHDATNLVQFDLESETMRMIPVKDFPAVRGSSFYGSAAVYVEKINRIYIFGGYTGRSDGKARSDEIWHISLNPLNTTQ